MVALGAIRGPCNLRTLGEHAASQCLALVRQRQREWAPDEKHKFTLLTIEAWNWRLCFDFGLLHSRTKLFRRDFAISALVEKLS